MMRLRVKTHAAFVVWSHAGARYASIRQDLLDIEEPCSKLQGIFDRKEVCHFWIRSLTPQQAAGNALAFAVQ